jgi:diadenosine tetraphosphate (Ap4A) HIT family hydrolase
MIIFDHVIENGFGILPPLHIHLIPAWKEAVFTDRLWQVPREELKIRHNIYPPDSFKISHSRLVV